MTQIIQTAVISKVFKYAGINVIIKVIIFTRIIIVCILHIFSVEKILNMFVHRWISLNSFSIYGNIDKNTFLSLPRYVKTCWKF